MPHMPLIVEPLGQRAERGPEAKKIVANQVGGYVLLDTEDAVVAQAWAERCPAAHWATVEIRGVAPCYS